MSATPFIKYDTSSGQIVQHAIVPEPDFQHQQPEDGQEIMAVEASWVREDLEREYRVDVETGEIVERPVLVLSKTEIAADGQDYAELDGMIADARVRVNNQPYDIPDGVLRIKTTMPGTYEVRVIGEQAFPYKPGRVKVTAT